jgi:hypothetical protein
MKRPPSLTMPSDFQPAPVSTESHDLAGVDAGSENHAEAPAVRIAGFLPLPVITDGGSPEMPCGLDLSLMLSLHGGPANTVQETVWPPCSRATSTVCRATAARWRQALSGCHPDAPRKGTSCGES